MDRLVKPGDIVVTNFPPLYQHWSLVTDRVCPNGRYMLISATDRNGTVKEETWDAVTQGKHTYIADFSYGIPLTDALVRARSQIGQWKYHLKNRNCEQFISWVFTGSLTSKQVTMAVGGAALGAAAVGVLAKKPTFAKFLGAAVLLGGLGLVAARADKKEPELTEE
ncbi:MAG: hypothetical protein B0D91_02295 [Oceanospirillales bacterium LUC14_002_19_P2]|nr:MAG: hypothetical protein B0D91_02295 [Oceanospirillales bacterium LUC14_002_19_P2]